MREIKIVRSGSLNQQEKLLQTKYQLNRSIFATCMPKKINPPKNLGIKSLTVAGNGKRAEHRLCELYRPAMSNNAPMDFIFGLHKPWNVLRELTMLHLIISIISVWKPRFSIFPKVLVRFCKVLACSAPRQNLSKTLLKP